MSESSSSSDFLARPFAALRAASDHAHEIAAPPYDVMNASEARAMAAGKPHSFLHVSRAEIDLPEGTDPYSDEVYAMAATQLAKMRADDVLVRDPKPAYYVYRISNGARTQTGLAFAASVTAYRQNRIRKHELTRPAKETDRVRQIEATKAITGPVMLVHRRNERLTALIAAATEQSSALLRADVDGWCHEVWAITDGMALDAISTCINAMDALFIADGHHRSAAAARITAPDDMNGTFLAVSFAEDDVTILDYNRVVADLNGRQPDAFLAELATRFEIHRSATAVRPTATHNYGLYLAAQWYSLTLKTPVDRRDPVTRLDVSVLDNLVLAPMLDIKDPRTDPRIDFIGGSRGPTAVAARVDDGSMAVGFTLFPTQMCDLIDVAEAGRIMPPKSTWFEPKLADGLLSVVLE